MSDRTFAVAYDVLNEGLIALSLGALLFIGGGVALGCVFLVRARRNKRRLEVALTTLWLIGWTSLSSLGMGNVLYQRWRCINWAKASDFQVIEGVVRDFTPMPRGGHADESFLVGNVRFSYSDFDLSKGGFNNTASHGGPVREGIRVRISYRDGRILKLEIAGDL